MRAHRGLQRSNEAGSGGCKGKKEYVYDKKDKNVTSRNRDSSVLLKIDFFFLVFSFSVFLYFSLSAFFVFSPPPLFPSFSSFLSFLFARFAKQRRALDRDSFMIRLVSIHGKLENGKKENIYYIETGVQVERFH